MLPLLTVLLACQRAPAPANPSSTPIPADDTAPPTPSTRPEPQTLSAPDSALDAGFGAALAVTPDGTLWIGAPHGTGGGALYRLPADTDLPAEILRTDGRLGSHLAAAADGTLAASAPLTGAIYTDDGALLSAPGAGAARAIWTGEWTLLPATLPPLTAVAARPRADGTWALLRGSALTDTVALDTGATWTAGGTREEAGSALAVGDFDGDGEDEWAVGAPAAERVYLLSAETLVLKATLLSVAGGRFGASLATVPDLDDDGFPELLVGAPMQGDLGEGAAHLYTVSSGTAPLWSWTGSAPRGMLGFAVAAGADRIALGEPGAGAAGAMQILVP